MKTYRQSFLKQYFYGRWTPACHRRHSSAEDVDDENTNNHQNRFALVNYVRMYVRMLVTLLPDPLLS